MASAARSTLSWRVDFRDDPRARVLAGIGLSSLVLQARHDARRALAPTARLSADNDARGQRDIE
jgi:hypothetical protein